MEHALAELARRFDVHPNLITQWKVQLLERMGEVFDWPAQSGEPVVDVNAYSSPFQSMILF